MHETLLQIPCELTGSATKSISKTTKLTFESQENVPAELISKITQNVGKTGWLCFLPEERQIDTMDVMDLPEIKVSKDEKSKALRLRNALYVLWEATGKVGTSEEHYNVQTEKLIDFIKGKIKEATGE